MIDVRKRLQDELNVIERELRVELAEGDPAGARARRSERKRRIQSRQGAPGVSGREESPACSSDSLPFRW